MRRMSTRTPQFVLIALSLISIILGYNYWMVSSQNGDLEKEIEKFQGQVKMGGLKQEQLENKNAALQGNMHNMASENNALSSRFKKQLSDDEEQIKTVQIELKQKTYEVTSLKNDLLKQQEIERDIQQQLESKEGKLEEIQKNIERILALKNDADEALAERDANIFDLKTKVQLLTEQLKISSARKDDLNQEPPKPGAFNIPNNDKKGSYLQQGSLNVARKKYLEIHNKGQEGIMGHNDAQILPIQPPNSIRAKPKFKIMNPEDGVNILPVENALKQPNILNNAPLIGNEKNEHVLAPPLQNLDENLDTAIDDAEKIHEDPLDDQDEEGKEIKQDLNKAEENYDNYDANDDKKVKDYNEPRGIGNIGLPKSLKEKRMNPNDMNEDHQGEILDDQFNNDKFLHPLRRNNEVLIEDTGSNQAHENINNNLIENKIEDFRKRH